MNSIVRDYLVSIEESQAHLVTVNKAAGNRFGYLQAQHNQQQAQAALLAIDGNAEEEREEFVPATGTNATHHLIAACVMTALLLAIVLAVTLAGGG